MRILITSAHSHEGEMGSAQIAEILARELSKKNHVLYLKLGDKFGSKKISPNLTYIMIPTANIKGIKLPIISPKIKKQIYNQISKFKPDVVHIENVIFGSLLGLIWAKENHVPTVLTLHHIPHEGMLFVFPRLKKNRLFSFADHLFSKIYSGTVINSSDLVIALNQSIVNSLEILNPETKYVAINNGIQINKFKSLKPKKPNTKVNFIFPGSYLDRKNQDYLIRVFRFLPRNYILNLYGRRDLGFSYLKWLEKLKAKYKLKNININDYALGQNLLNAYKNSNYLVSASVKEVQSLVIIEALAAGLPVIALANETTLEVINSENGIVMTQATRPKQFAEKLKKYINSTNKNFSEVSYICKQSVARFDIKEVAEKTADTYRSIIDKYDNSSEDKKHITLVKIFLVISMLIGTLAKIFSTTSQFSEKQIETSPYKSS